MKAGSFLVFTMTPRQDILWHCLQGISKAGFEMKTSPLFWLYHCLSEDTEVLTEQGWERYNKTNKFKRSKILIYNIDKDDFKFEKPIKWNEYNHRGFMYSISSRNTNQLVTGNHKVFVERGLVEAKDLHEQEKIVYLSELPEEVLGLSICIKKGGWGSLFKEMQRTNENESTNKIQQRKQFVAKELDSETQEETSRENDGGQKLGLERRSNLLQNTWELCWSKIYSLSERILTNGSERWLCYGASPISCSTIETPFIENRSSASFRPQSNEQQNRESNFVCEQQRPQIARIQPQYKTTLATVSKELYEGLVFCPTVSTGCFVARRKGKIFLTGNSGFPKACDISKQIDKKAGTNLGKEFCELIKNKRLEKGWSTIELANKGNFYGKVNHGGSVSNWEEGKGTPTLEQYNKLIELLDLNNFEKLSPNEREVIGKSKTTIGIGCSSERMGGEHNITNPINELSKEWSGFKSFQLKPSVEMILCVQKPRVEKTIVGQVLANGCGAVNIEKCRIPYGGVEPNLREDKGKWDKAKIVYNDGKKCYHKYEGLRKNPENQGRFPANLLVSGEPLKGNTYRQGGNGSYSGYDNKTNNSTFAFGEEGVNRNRVIADKSNNPNRFYSLDAWWEKRNITLTGESAFFDVPKPSKAEKNKGLEDYYILKKDIPKHIKEELNNILNNKTL